jgi:excisionase family DNA binding protein
MRRTRKWAYVAQEAQRLADLQLTVQEIADRLEVHQTTVDRWIASGKLKHAKGLAPGRTRVVLASNQQTAGQWASAVRGSYDLDATDEQLVSLAEDALLVARDPATPAQLRLQAMGRYQGIVKQLALVARAADEQKPEVPKRKTFQPPKRTGTDPRGILSEVG